MLFYSLTDSFYQFLGILSISTSKYAYNISRHTTQVQTSSSPLTVKMNVAEPYICIPGVPNFRDIGGYAIDSDKNKQVRRNVVFRSALPRHILDDGSERAKNKLQTLGITEVFDLRSENEFLEVRAYDWRQWLWSEMRRVWAPVFRPEEYNLDSLADQYMESGCSPEVCQITLS
jgi:hypothetical protein